MKVCVRPTNRSLPRIFEGQMSYGDVEDMLSKIDNENVDTVHVTKSTIHYSCTHNIHSVHIYDKATCIEYDIRFTYNQFNKIQPLLRGLGEIKVDEYSWFGR